MAGELASGNPTLAPLAIAIGLFVLLLGGLLVAMARISHVSLRPPRRESTPQQRQYVKRVLRLFRRESHPYDARVVSPSPVVARAERSR